MLICRSFRPLRGVVRAQRANLLSARRGLSSLQVPIPELGAESIVEGGILSINKKVGDFVAAEEMVAEIETGMHRASHRAPYSSTAYIEPHANFSHPVSLLASLVVCQTK